MTTERHANLRRSERHAELLEEIESRGLRKGNTGNVWWEAVRHDPTPPRPSSPSQQGTWRRLRDLHPAIGLGGVEGEAVGDLQRHRAAERARYHAGMLGDQAWCLIAIT